MKTFYINIYEFPLVETDNEDACVGKYRQMYLTPLLNQLIRTSNLVCGTVSDKYNEL